MKTKTIKFLMMFFVGITLTLVGCNNDDGGPSTPLVEATCDDGEMNGDETGVDCGGSSCTACPEPVSTELNGSTSEDLTLDPAQEYQLTGKFSVESGATLTIPAGTRIVADAAEDAATETETYIVVQKGAMIDVQGTADSPVVMTSTNEEAGDWGGLILLGDATTTAGIDAMAEVGGLIYGGTNDEDNSGSISYLIINYAGANANPEVQFNGLTLYAVGSGTTIDNVAMLNGDDDGVEFFGGTVSATNMYMENNADDAIDWTEGWNGTLTNAYVAHTIEGFSTAVEADGENGNPILTNLTAVSTTGGTAMQFKFESGATITGLSLSGYETSLDFRDDGAVSNVQIEGVDSDPALAYNAAPTVDVETFAWVESGLEVPPTTGATEVLPDNITEDLTLDANVAYSLSGKFSVESGATLTIPAGTRIVADAAEDAATETETYIVVQKGAMIDVQGTADSPVVMTSTNEEAGDWGGLILLGDATTTAGIDASAEVGGLIYGGSNNEDNSGSISYLIINYAGANANPEVQFNGLTLYAVGSGTTIDNVVILNGDDDGVEFFGGTVSATNMYMENNADDAIDWTEGWNGTLTNAYVSHTIEGFSTAVEADGENGNPTLENLTAVSTTGGTAMQFKFESGATITGLSLSGYETSLDFRDDGAVSNVQIEGADSNPAEAYEEEATVDIATFSWAGVSAGEEDAEM